MACVEICGLYKQENETIKNQSHHPKKTIKIPF